MSVIAQDRLAWAVTTAQRVLSARAGATVTVSDPVDLGGSGRTDVVRVRVAANPITMDRTLVLKIWPDDVRTGGADHGFARELASYKYATALPMRSRPGPHLIAFDLAARIIVLSDLGDGRPMSDLLSGSDPDRASYAISAWGQALGRLHAATVGGEQDFAALLRHGPDRSTTQALSTLVRAAIDGSGDILQTYLGLSADPDFDAMLRRGADLVDEGDHRAFSPSDVGSPNILINDAGVQFMDYEWGGFRDATLDIAYAVVGLGGDLAPRLARHREALQAAMIEAWRSEVRAIWPSLGHDGELHRRLFMARALWVWMSTVWMVPADSGGGSDAGDLALHTTDPAVIVARWADLAAAGRRAGLSAAAVRADAIGAALDAAWLR